MGPQAEGAWSPHKLEEAGLQGDLALSPLDLGLPASRTGRKLISVVLSP